MKRKTKVKVILASGYAALFCLSYNACAWFFQSDIWNTYRDEQISKQMQSEQKAQEQKEAQRPKDLVITLLTEEQQGVVTIYQKEEGTGEVYQESYTGRIKETETKGKRNISIYAY